MTDKDISRIEPKGVKGLKAFNDAFKDGQGYVLPEGGIYAFNDIVRHFDRIIPPYEVMNSGREYRDLSDGSNDVILFFDRVKNDANVFRIKLLSKENMEYKSRPTQMSKVYDRFVSYYKAAIFQGHIGVFRRSDERNANILPTDVDVSFQNRDVYGFLFSKDELLACMDEYAAYELSDPNDLRLLNALKGHFDKMFSRSTDYSGITLEAVNAPIPQSKLKKPSVRAENRQGARLKGISI